MDLIAVLSSQLGLDSDKAQGLAGVALGKLEEQITQKLGGADAASLASAIPELGGWKAKAEALTGGGETAGGGLLGGAGGLLGGAGGLLGGAGGLLGGAGGLLGKSGGGVDLAGLLQVVSKVGLSPQSVQTLLPLVLQFLQSRLDPALVNRILGVLPMLKGGAGGGGGLAGALGSILGG